MSSENDHWAVATFADQWRQSGGENLFFDSLDVNAIHLRAVCTSEDDPYYLPENSVVWQDLCTTSDDNGPTWQPLRSVSVILDKLEAPRDDDGLRLWHPPPLHTLPIAFHHALEANDYDRLESLWQRMMAWPSKYGHDDVDPSYNIGVEVYEDPEESTYRWEVN